MHTFVIVTSADPSRVGLSYKIEMPNWALEEWFVENKEVLLAQRHAFNTPSQRGNTSITHIDERGSVSAKTYLFEWADLYRLLQKAEDVRASAYADEIRPGRPEKRVLVLTTSKERRTGSLVARQAF
jgi:hypothetical protein